MIVGPSDAAKFMKICTVSVSVLLFVSCLRSIHMISCLPCIISLYAFTVLCLPLWQACCNGSHTTVDSCHLVSVFTRFFLAVNWWLIKDDQFTEL